MRLVWACGALPALWLALRTAGLVAPSLGANPVAALADATGLDALRLLLLTLAMTPARRLSGSAEWVVLRRPLGLLAAGYALLHGLVWVLLDRRGDLGHIGSELARRPWITLGALALAILAVLAATSTAAAMRRLGRRWLTLHRLVYLAGLAACWHYYWQVKRDVSAPLAYAAVFALLMALRLRRRRVASPASRSPAPWAAAAQREVSAHTQAGTRDQPPVSSRSRARQSGT